MKRLYTVSYGEEGTSWLFAESALEAHDAITGDWEMSGLYDWDDLVLYPIVTEPCADKEIMITFCDNDPPPPFDRWFDEDEGACMVPVDELIKDYPCGQLICSTAFGEYC